MRRLYPRYGKRLLDLSLAVPAGLLVLPFLATAWLLSKSTTGASGLFRQERVGVGGRPFEIWKLRTMRQQHTVESLVGVTVAGHEGITPVGLLLRRWKLDELPQLFNVVRGHMSLVGPRPDVRSWVDRFPLEFAPTLTVRPGLTSLASLAYYDEERLVASYPDPLDAYERKVLPHKLELNRRYVENVGLLLDLRILLLTGLFFVAPERASRAAERLAGRLGVRDGRQSGS